MNPVLDIDTLKLEDIKVKENGSSTSESAPVVDKPVEKPLDKPLDKPADKSALPPLDDKPVDKPIDKPVDDKSVDQPKDTASDLIEYTPEEQQVFTDLSSLTGVKVGSDDDVVNSLKELAGFRSGKIPGESAVLTKAREIEKSGGNLTAFFRALSRDPEKMGDHDVLREAFLEKSERAKTNPSLASRDFERDLRTKYGAWMSYEKMPAKTAEEQQAKAAFYEENADDIDYQKELYSDDVKQSRTAFKEIQANFPVEKKQEGMTQAQIDEIAKLHERESVAAIGAFKGLEIALTGENKFTVGLSDKTKPTVEGWARDPEKFLNAIGFHPDKIDYGRLVNVMALVADVSAGGFGERFQKHVLALKDINTLENDLDKNAQKIDRGQSAADGKGDLMEQVGAAFETKRASQQRV